MQQSKKGYLSEYKRKITLLESLFAFKLIFFLCFSVYGQDINLQKENELNKFQASVVKIDITPENSQYLLGFEERKSTGIDTRIYHRIMVLEDKNTRFLLVSSELCLFSPIEYDRIAEIVQNQFGIKSDDFWWSVTHTHSAPEFGPYGLDEVFLERRFMHQRDTDYTEFVEKELIKGIKKAITQLEPARLGVGWGYSSANINRRAKDIDKKSFIGIEPDGPVDRKVGILRIDKKDESPLACIANYPIHGTALGNDNLKINGDVPGIVSDHFEQETGVPLLFINGAAGNLSPIYCCQPNPVAGHLSQFQIILGDKIVEAYKKILFTTKEVNISTGSLVIETPKKYGIKWPENHNNYLRTANTGLGLIRLPVRFLKLNEDIAVWSAPVELF